jgi:hypothetical protein
MRKHFPVFLVFIVLVLGCSFQTVESTKIAPSEISQVYNVSLKKTETNVIAHFYTDGATVDLDAPSRIELNGREMRESPPSFLKTTDYHYDSSKFESSFQFAFFASDGKIYRNEMNIEPLEIIGQYPNLSRSGETKFQLSRAVAPNESVSFSLRSQQIQFVSDQTNAGNSNTNSQPTQTFSAEDTVRLDNTRTFFTIDSKQLKNFAPGKASLKIEVVKHSDLQQSTGKGGHLSIRYESQTLSFDVSK